MRHMRISVLDARVSKRDEALEKIKSLSPALSRQDFQPDIYGGGAQV